MFISSGADICLMCSYSSRCVLQILVCSFVMHSGGRRTQQKVCLISLSVESIPPVSLISLNVLYMSTKRWYLQKMKSFELGYFKLKDAKDLEQASGLPTTPLTSN